MTSRRVFVQLLAAIACCITIRAQTPTTPAAPTAPATLAVAGDVSTPLTLSAEDIKSLPRTRVEAKEEGRTVVYEGVLVGEILKRAGAPLGGDLRGKAMAT